MADRRMLTTKIIDDDKFIALSAAAQSLYMHLCLSADDDGFSGQVSLSKFKAHATDDEISELIDKGFIYQFDSGIVVIRHWARHNLIRKDTYKETLYVKEKSLLEMKNDEYYLVVSETTSSETAEIQESQKPVTERYETVTERYETVTARYKSVPQYSIDKDSIVKDSIVKRKGECEGENQNSPGGSSNDKKAYGEHDNVLLTDEELVKLQQKYGKAETEDAIEYFSRYLKGNPAQAKKYKSHIDVMRNWVFGAAAKAKRELEYNKASPKSYNNYQTHGYSDTALKEIEKQLTGGG